ncbi:MAG: PCYCGC motif-containing (lipo)protein [Dehalococcoidia bacterium]
MGKCIRSSKKPHEGRQGAGGRRWLYLAFSTAAVLVIGIGGLVLFGDGSPQPPAETVSLPPYVARAPLVVQEAYAYISQHPETTAYIPCYCGCGRHSGHRSIQDCFVAGRGAEGSVVYDPHGSGCAMCVDIALITKRMVRSGNTLSTVRKFVDDKYGHLGPPTDTPPIPQ